jgi:murein DD-endopeptidase MepM/ murein hydrolase activator NlpD
MQPYIDPLDLEPKISTASLRASMRQRDAAPKADGESFDEVMKQQQVKQEPTPVWVPKPLTAQAEVQASVSKPAEVAPQPDPTESAVAGISETIPVTPKPIEHNRPSNLREMLQPVQEETAVPTQIEQKPEAELSIETPELQPEQDQIKEVPIVEPEINTNPVTAQYVVQHGDTLSDIVASHMKQSGMDYSTRDVYTKVREVAQHNGLSNPDRIYSGNTIDLSPLQQHEDLIAKLPSLNMQGLAASSNLAAVTSDFGMRSHPISNETRHHNGIDIQADEGTPVLPAKDGVVTFSGEQSGYGNMIEVDHGDGTQTRYAHLSERLANFGERVSPNQPLALSGSTGNVTGPHLHFEYHQNGEAVDPENYVDPSTLLGNRSSISQLIK